MGQKRFLIGSLISFGMIFVFGASLAAGAHLNVNMGFGGYVVPGCWTPLTVQVSGPKAGMRVEVVRQVEEGLRPAVESFPYQEGNKVECPIFVDEYYNQVKVRLLSGEQLIAEQDLEPTPKIFPGHLILTLNLPVAAQQEIRLSLQPVEPVLVVPIEYQELPSLVLDYDGVSGLVITDPGPILTPAQTRAIRGWLVGGGRMVIWGVRPFEESISRLFVEKMKVDHQREAVVLPIGLGSITMIPWTEGYSSGSTGSWRQILDLRPYQQSRRLMVSRCFPEPDPLKPLTSSPQRGQNFLLIILILWATVILFVNIIKFKNGTRYLLLCTVIFTILAFPVAIRLSGIWQRGVLLQTRAIILPSAGGTLFNTVLSFQQTDDLNTGTSPWGIDVAWGLIERGKIMPGVNRSKTWRHTGPSPIYVIQSIDSSSVKFVGWVFLGNARNFNPSEADVLSGRYLGAATPILWDGKHWRSSDLADSEWQKIISGRIPASIDNITNLRILSSIPQWLANETGWLARLQRVSPGSIWLFGFSDLSTMNLTVQGSRVSKVLWAKLLSKL